jgi:hypothetical protein
MVILMMYYVFQVSPTTIYQYIKSLIQVNKIVDFSPHQVVINELKYLKHVIATRMINDITTLCKFDYFGVDFSIS